MVTLPKSSRYHDDLIMERKITIATEGFTSDRFCESVLRYRKRLSKDNAMTISDYIMARYRYDILLWLQKL